MYKPINQIKMKKTILFTLLALSLNNVFSQSKEGFSKGNSFISGSFNFQSETTGSVKENTIDFSPRFGYFISDNIALGGRLSLGQNKTTDSIVIENNSVVSVGAFARYYTNPKSRFSVFGHLGFNYNTETEKISKSSVTGFDVALSPGFSYFVSDRFAIEATFGRLGFETSKPDVDGAESTKNIDFDINMSSVGFGLIYKF
jgi:outer membrane protein